MLDLEEDKDTHKDKVASNKIPALTKVRIWPFRLLVQQINSIAEVLKLKQKFQNNKVVTGKTPFFVVDPFCTHYFICFRIGFWYDSFVWK